MFKKLKMKMSQKIVECMQGAAAEKVAEFEKTLVDKICHRIEILACDNNENYDLEYILNDIKNKGYLLADDQRRV